MYHMYMYHVYMFKKKKVFSKPWHKVVCDIINGCDTKRYLILTGSDIKRALSDFNQYQNISLKYHLNLCGTGPQTPEYVLQPCPMQAEARLQHWPNWTTLADKLWSSNEEFMTTTNFINGTGHRI